MIMRRSGFTLTELLVCIGIFSILTAMALLALNSVRSAARNTACQSKVADLLKATMNFESVRNELPDKDWQGDLKEFLELVPINADQPRFAQLICPEESYPETVDQESVLISYAACSGTWSSGKVYDGVINPNGLHPFFGGKGTRLSSVVDGTSNTAIFAEAALAREGGQKLSTLWRSKRKYSEGELEQFVDECLSMPKNPAEAGWDGSSYPKSIGFKLYDGRFVPYIGLTCNLYNHALPPQQPACLNVGSPASAIAAASSFHGTVNVGFLDGHVSSVDPNVDLVVWRSMATLDDQ